MRVRVRAGRKILPMQGLERNIKNRKKKERREKKEEKRRKKEK